MLARDMGHDHHKVVKVEAHTELAKHGDVVTNLRDHRVALSTFTPVLLLGVLLLYSALNSS